MQMKIEDRAQFVDRSLDKYFTCMDRVEDQDIFYGFCEKLGYSAVAEFLMDPNSFKVVMPDSYLDLSKQQSGVIPIVPLGSDDEMEVELAIHPLQVCQAVLPITDGWDLTLPTNELALASVWSPSVEHEDGEEGTLLVQRTYPLVTINVEAGYKQTDLVCPTTFVHEIAHLAQVLAKPLLQFDLGIVELQIARSRLEDEIEAYSLQSDSYMAMMDDISRVTSISMAHTVEPLRWVTMKDSYILNQDFIDKGSSISFIRRIIPEVLLPV